MKVDREMVVNDLKWFKSRTRKTNIEIEDIPRAFFGYLKSPLLFHTEEEVILPMPNVSSKSNHVLIVYNPDKELIVKTPLKISSVIANIRPPEEKEDLYWEKCKTYNKGSWKWNESEHCRMEIIDDHTVKVRLYENVPAKVELEGYAQKPKKLGWKVTVVAGDGKVYERELVESQTQYLHLISLDTVKQYYEVAKEVYASLPIEEYYLKVLYSPKLKDYLYCRYRIKNGSFDEGYIYVNLWFPTTPDPLKEPDYYVKADKILSIREWENKTTWGGDWDKEKGMSVVYVRNGEKEKQVFREEASYSVQTGLRKKITDKLGVLIPVYSYEEMIKKLVEHGVDKDEIEKEFSKELGERLKAIFQSIEYDSKT